MRQTWRSNRVTFLLVCLIFCGSLFACSLTGILSPIENIAAQPLNFLSGLFNRITLTANTLLEDVSEIETLRERNADLEEQLALLQAELIDLREIANDYERLANLLEYTGTATDQEFITADVINIDQRSFLRNIVINRGTRDGINVGMPVITDLGLVGRITNVSANAARVQLITDQNSAVSSRLQTSRAQGTTTGQLTGNLRMQFIPLGSEIIQGDLVITSGLGGNYPPDLVIGQVQSSQQFEFELFQEAEVRSLIDFDALEIVLVITSFQPVDITVFEEEEP